MATAVFIILQKRDVWEIFRRYMTHGGNSSACLNPAAAANETHDFTHDLKRREELGLSGAGGHPSGKTTWEGDKSQVSVA